MKFHHLRYPCIPNKTRAYFCVSDNIDTYYFIHRTMRMFVSCIRPEKGAVGDSQYIIFIFIENVPIIMFIRQWKMVTCWNNVVLTFPSFKILGNLTKQICHLKVQKMQMSKHRSLMSIYRELHFTIYLPWYLYISLNLFNVFTFDHYYGKWKMFIANFT